MTTYFTADPHFGHERIIELCDRPFSSVGHMNDQLVRRFNSVPDRTRLVILGDTCMGKLEYSLPVLSRLEYEEILLVPGNHDRWSNAYHHKGTPEEQAEKRATWRERYNDVDSRIRTFEDFTPSFWFADDLGLGGEFEKTLFSHYPYDGDSHGEDRYAHLRAADDGFVMVHGHVHGEWHTKGRQVNVGVDVRDFTPVSEMDLALEVKELSS